MKEDRRVGLSYDSDMGEQPVKQTQQILVALELLRGKLKEIHISSYQIKSFLFGSGPTANKEKEREVPAGGGALDHIQILAEECLFYTKSIMILLDVVHKEL